MATLYTREKNAQILISLLKAHGIRFVIASPGNTNTSFISSIQNDSSFTVFSAVDERSAAYMACGLAAEAREAVVISCTGATASRNYLPAMTEAYYRKLPILAVTSSQVVSKVAHHSPQLIDRSTLPNDVARLSVHLPVVKDEEDRWSCEVKVNTALLELHRGGGGPVHVNLPTIYDPHFDVATLPQCRSIERITEKDTFPQIEGRVALFVGSHEPWSRELVETVDAFCATNDAVVFCDHTSGYSGKYRVLYALVAGQEQHDFSEDRPDILIHMGEISGDYYSLGISAKREVWRVSSDGVLRDTFRRLKYVFEMPEIEFFRRYSEKEKAGRTNYLEECQNRLSTLRSKLPRLPLSNIWVASVLAHKLPTAATVHFGILNSLRSWNFFELPEGVSSNCNVGGFGIDGGVSALLGASLYARDRLFFMVTGDLAFFYDLNALGNRHIAGNLRILLINNGKGTEFRQYNHHAARFGDDADKFIAAAGHFGRRSRTLVKHFAIDLGFDYRSADDKAAVEASIEWFTTPEVTQKPLLFEVFTESADESTALHSVLSIERNPKVRAAKYVAGFLGENGRRIARKLR
ncbi:MAG: thiamine pyrophosphate-binding protein [Pseudomonadota bacterium]